MNEAHKRELLIEAACMKLRRARKSLRLAGADKAADYVQRSLKSAEGALRHARGRQYDANKPSADLAAVVAFLDEEDSHGGFVP